MGGIVDLWCARALPSLSCPELDQPANSTDTAVRHMSHHNIHNVLRVRVLSESFTCDGALLSATPFTTTIPFSVPNCFQDVSFYCAICRLLGLCIHFGWSWQYARNVEHSSNQYSECTKPVQIDLRSSSYNHSQCKP